MSCQRFGFARARPQGSAGVGLSRQDCGPRDRFGGSGARGSGLGLPGENFRRGSLLQLHVLGCSTGGVGSLCMESGPQIRLAEAYLQLVSAANLVKNWWFVGCFLLVFAADRWEVQHGRLSSQRSRSKAAAQVQIGRQRMLVKSFKLRVF